jgi:hypothetical protein
MKHTYDRTFYGTGKLKFTSVGVTRHTYTNQNGLLSRLKPVLAQGKIDCYDSRLKNT